MKFQSQNHMCEERSSYRSFLMRSDSFVSLKSRRWASSRSIGDSAISEDMVEPRKRERKREKERERERKREKVKERRRKEEREEVSRKSGHRIYILTWFTPIFGCGGFQVTVANGIIMG